jgi:hypothetical protein
MTDFTITCPVGDEPLSPGNPNPSSKAKAYRFDCREHGFLGYIQRPVIDRLFKEKGE